MKPGPPWGPQLPSLIAAGRIPRDTPPDFGYVVDTVQKAAQEDLAKLLPNAKHITNTNSGHDVGWVVVSPQGSRPLILQKAGGLQGSFSYTAFAPSRGVGVFVAVNEFNLAGAIGMMKAANDLIGELAPR